jgi:ABC-type sugar transport system ATPase subunit
MTSTSTPILEMRGMCKDYPGVRALRNVDLTLERGECLALCGENGAGKSTLIKLLGGATRPNRGEIRIDGEAVRIASPHAAQRLGISIIYQELNLVPQLSVRENIFLGREGGRFGFPDLRHETEVTRRLFRTLGLEIDAERRCAELTVAQRQAVEIAKALAFDARIIVMDEPSAALTESETQKLLGIVRELKCSGIGVLYISHRLDEIFAIAERVTVLRDGAHVTTEDTSRVDRDRLIELMVGRPLDTEFPPRNLRVGAERLRVEGLTRGRTVRDMSFSVFAGEVVGLAGLVGAGRTETVRLIFGADIPDAGVLTIDGEICAMSSPGQAIACGVGLLTEDRKSQGLVPMHSARENFGLPNLDRFSCGPFVDTARETVRFGHFVRALDIRMTDPEQTAATLSGGNQQKVVLAKWLERDCRVIIFDEPTRGIDVGAKYEIYLLINALAEQGKAIIVVSSELPELLGVSDRILVMHEGALKGEIRDVAHATQEQILSMMVH